MENIRYGRLDATDEDCIAAAKILQAQMISLQDFRKDMIHRLTEMERICHKAKDSFLQLQEQQY